MNVGQLRKVIARMPDDAPVLIPGSDHSHYEGHASDGKAVQEGGREWGEYFGKEYLQPGDEVVRALIVSAG